MNSWETDTEGLTSDTALSELIERVPYKTTEDKQGHDSFLGARFPKQFTRWVDSIRELSGSPYQNRADVVRDAIYLGLVIISLRHNLSPNWRTMEKLAQVSGVAAEIAGEYSKIEHLIPQLQILVANKQLRQARDIVRDYVKVLNEFPSEKGESLTGKFMGEIRSHGLSQLL